LFLSLTNGFWQQYNDPLQTSPQDFTSPTASSIEKSTESCHFTTKIQTFETQASSFQDLQPWPPKSPTQKSNLKEFTESNTPPTTTKSHHNGNPIHY